LGGVSFLSEHARSQYATTTANLTARMALHDYGTNPETWWEWLTPRLPRDGRVLEVGAGTGELWQHLPHGPLTLVDFSPAMCARLRQVPGARVLRADAGALPFPGEAFDTVIANHMLYHVDDPGLALREFARVLAPGGRVAVAVNGRDHMADLEDFGTPGRAPLRLNGFSAETAPPAMAEVFDDVTVERYPGDLAVPTSEPVLAYLDSWTALTGAERAAAARRIQERIDADGAFRIREHTVLVMGRLTR
jgi:SAM-dependent methyltransferase